MCIQKKFKTKRQALTLPFSAMSRGVRNNLDLLKALVKAAPSQRKAILHSANRECIDALCECALNILIGNIPLTPSQKKKLIPYKNHLRKLIDKKLSLKKKKGILSQRGGNFLSALLGPVLQGLVSVLS